MSTFAYFLVSYWIKYKDSFTFTFTLTFTFTYNFCLKHFPRLQNTSEMGEETYVPYCYHILT
jgi:hypothetical protein